MKGTPYLKCLFFSSRPNLSLARSRNDTIFQQRPSIIEKVPLSLPRLSPHFSRSYLYILQVV